VAGSSPCSQRAWRSLRSVALGGLRCLPVRFGNMERRLRAELEQEFQTRLARAARPQTAQEPVMPLRQAPQRERLYAAPDGVMYCTTERDQETGKVRWRELKVAAVYAARPASEEGGQPLLSKADGEAPLHEPVRARLGRWLRKPQPPCLVAVPEQATQVTYVAETRSWEQFGPRLWAELRDAGTGVLGARFGRRSVRVGPH